MKFILDASTAVDYSSPRDAVALSKVGSIVVPVIWRVEVASALHQAILAKDLTPAAGDNVAGRRQAGRIVSPAHHVRSDHANVTQGQD